MKNWQIFLICTVIIILAIGGFYFIFFIRNKGEGAKKIKNRTYKKIPFKVDNFIENLGTITNIIATEAKLTRIKIIVKDIKLVNFINIRKLKQQGIIKHSNAITIVFGRYSRNLAKIINERLK